MFSSYQHPAGSNYPISTRAVGGGCIYIATQYTSQTADVTISTDPCTPVNYFFSSIHFAYMTSNGMMIVNDELERV
jgi:hypothetical protein